MNWEILRNSSLVENLGWTLVHSIWQIGLIAFVLFVVLRTLKDSSANARYLFAVAALGLMLVLPIATFISLSNNSAHNRSARQSFDIERLNPARERETTPEILSMATAENDLQTAGSPTENDYFSIENLRINFTSGVAFALPFFVLLWIFGVGFFALRLAGGVWQLHKYKTCEISAPETAWQNRFAALCAKLKITQTVKFLQSTSIKTPVVVGWLKPVILVPTSVFLQMSPLELETILAHELLHIRRLDNLINCLQSLAEILFFYHPCGWWISGVVRREREFACDAAVLETLNAAPFVYATALANLEEIRSTANQHLPPLAVAATGGKLMQRIEKILQKKAESGRNSKQTLWSAGCLAFLIASAVLTTVFWTGTNVAVNAQTKIVNKNKKIAVGFVSIPPLVRMRNAPEELEAKMRFVTQMHNMLLIIAGLKRHEIPAIGFVQGAAIFDGEKSYPARTDAVRMWRDQGFEIGIGGYRHIWFYDNSVEDYIANAEKNEKITKQILAEKNMPLKYFSYPFLNTGKTADDKNRFENWLGERGLKSVKYTIDNQEWMYSYAYDEAVNNRDDAAKNRIRAEFLDYMSKMFDHYEAYSQELFGRDINQTIVLTPSRLVADASDDLYGMIENRGYRFVSMDEAQADEAYQTAENFAGVKAGISWFERWQMAQGKKLRDEPKVDKSVEDVWNDRGNKKAPPPPRSPVPPMPPPPPPPPAPPEIDTD